MPLEGGGRRRHRLALIRTSPAFVRTRNRDARGMAAPILEAIRAGDAAAVAAILARDPGQAAATDPDGLGALMLAQYARRPDLVAMLRAARPRLDLFEAAALGDLAAVQAALADPDAARAVAADGFQALHLAAYFGRLEIVDALLAAGADPDAVAANAARLRPLHSAAAAGHAEVAERLLRAGADPNARQQGGWTPLHAAALNRDQPLEQLLLRHGADPKLTTDDGRTAAAMVTDQAD
jgi:ankyrin repeat protein